MAVTDKIIDSIEKTRKWPEEIEASILFYLCSISRNGDHHSRSEYLYEHYLTSNNYQRPTELIVDYELNAKSYDEKKIFYLKEICIPDIMKKSIYFLNYDDVEKERIQICHALKNIDSKNQKDYLQEIKDRERNLFIKKESSRIEKNKVYVDINGIKRIYENELKDDYERLLRLIKSNHYKEDSKIKDILNGVKDISAQRDLSEKELFSTVYLPDLPENEVDDLFKKIIEIARDIFVKNEHYGLDVYLSTKIRHGTISNHLRKPLEKENLITLKDSNLKEYQINNHWNTEFYTWDQKELDKLQMSLRKFSKRHDEIIKYLSGELLQVSTSLIRTDIEGKVLENENKNALFKYYYSDLELKDMLYTILNENISFDDFIMYLLQGLWEKTDINLKKIRNTLEQDVKAMILTNFDDLQWNIADVKYDVSLLTNAMATSRTEMSQYFNSLVAWFGRMEDSERNDFEIQNVVDMVENIFKKQDKYLYKNIESKDLFKGKTLDSFVDIFFILIHNAFKHSGLNDQTKIELSIKRMKNIINIEVKNNLKTDEDIKVLEDRAIAIMKEYGTEKAMINIHKEGKTGFPKLWKLINKDLLVPTHNLDVKYSNDDKIIKFCVKLEIDAKGILV